MRQRNAEEEDADRSLVGDGITYASQNERSIFCLILLVYVRSLSVAQPIIGLSQ